MISGEVKLCECGCGGQAPISKWNDKRGGYISGETKRFICGHNKKGKNNPAWKGGTTSYGKGRTVQYAPNHPRALNNRYVLSHRWIAENALGKIIPENIPIHHHLGTQLVVCENHAYHMLLHQRVRALKNCGHANWRKCWICKKYDAPENMVIKSRSRVHHALCMKRKRREIYLAKKSRGMDGESGEILVGSLEQA